MTTRILLLSLAITWLLAVLLIPCLESIPRMIAWLFLFAGYLFYVHWHVIEVECFNQQAVRFVGPIYKPPSTRFWLIANPDSGVTKVQFADGRYFEVEQSSANNSSTDGEGSC